MLLRITGPFCYTSAHGGVPAERVIRDQGPDMDVGLTFRLPAWTIQHRCRGWRCWPRSFRSGASQHAADLYDGRRANRPRRTDHRPTTMRRSPTRPQWCCWRCRCFPFSPLTRARIWCFVNLCLLEAILLIIAHMLWPTIAASGSGSGRVVAAVKFPRGFAAGDCGLGRPIPHLAVGIQSHYLIVSLSSCWPPGHGAARDARAGPGPGWRRLARPRRFCSCPCFAGSAGPVQQCASSRRRWRLRCCRTCCFRHDPQAVPRPALGRPVVRHLISKVHADLRRGRRAWYSWNMINQGLAATIYRLSTSVESRGNVSTYASCN